MRRPGRAALVEAAFVLLLAGAAALATYDHQRVDSPTFDEPIHLFGGVEYVQDGTYWANLEHPPLLKALAAAALLPYDVRSPGAGTPAGRSPSGRYFEWLYANRIPAHSLLDVGRRPFPALLALLVVVVFLLARALWGPPAAFLAAALVALDPNAIAHAGVVHTDVGAALTMTAALGLALLATTRGHLGWWTGAGAALGLALASKFTAMLLVPAFLALPLLALRLPPGGWKPFARRLGGLAIAFATALAVLYGAYAWCLRRMPPELAERAAVEFLAGRGASEEAIARAAAFSRISPPLAHYAAGLWGTALESAHGRGANFLRGRVSERGFPEYFLVAFLVKSTPALLAVVAAAALLGRRRLLDLRALALLLPAALLFLAASRSCFNIGVRHVLPAYPLLAITASGVLAATLPPRLFRAGTVAALVSAGTSVLAIHPLEIAYFNAAVGSPEKGSGWLVDSNLDWGQDMRRLATFLAARGWEESTTLVVYSGLANDYFSRRARVLAPGEPVRPGRYVVGATVLALGGAYVGKLEGPAAAAQVDDLRARLAKDGRRVAWVGGGLTVWELPAPSAGEPRAGPPRGAAPGG